MRDGHVKDAAHNVAEDVTQDAAEGVLGAAEDETPSVSGGRIIAPVANPQLPPHPPRPPKISSSTVSSSPHQALFEH